jgi:SAM-dependent methyltransferase
MSMDWVRAFYHKQQHWARVCSGGVEAFHRRRAELVSCPDCTAPYRILELGCGGGQTVAALADRGHTVVGIDLLPEAIDHASKLAAERVNAQITLIEGDFYAFKTQALFDIVCYFDGFGIGTDQDQQRLLRRISSWLQPYGRAFIDVYAPTYWSRQAGTVMTWPDVTREYGFDHEGCRMLDTWWPTGQPELAVTQSLRCYAPAEFKDLLNGTELSIARLAACEEFSPKTEGAGASWEQADEMQYRVILANGS